MEVKWLMDFLSLAETGNFSRSAESRATTQPAFSRRIKALEEWVGVPLFDRSKKPVALTPAGERFHPIAESVLRRLFQARDEIRQMGQTTENTLSFCSTHSLSLTFFPDWIRQIEERIGVLLIRLNSDQVGNCVHAMLHGESHFMMCHTHSSVDILLPGDRYLSVKVGEDRLLPVSSPDAQGKPTHSLLKTADKTIPHLAYAETSAIGRAVDHLLVNHLDKPQMRRVFETHLAAVLKTMAKDGRGLAWLPEQQILSDLKTGTLVVSGDDSWAVPVDIRVFRSRDPLPPAAEEFWTALHDTGSALD